MNIYICQNMYMAEQMIRDSYLWAGPGLKQAVEHF